MRRSVATLIVLALVSALPLAHASDQARTLLVVGDSLSAGYGLEPDQGWVTLLQRRLEAEGYGYRVVNASITGDTTSGGLRRLPRALEQHRPAVVLIELGGNDGLRGTPVAVIRRNLASMIELAQEAGARVVLAGIQMPPNYGSKYATAFAAIYPDLAREHRIGLIEFFMEDVALDRTLMQADGVHPNAAGQSKLLETAWPVLERELAAAGASAASHVGPEGFPAARGHATNAAR
jgi:acyl-CoA thioesterase-1